MLGLRKTPQYTLAKENILPKRQKQVLLPAEQESKSSAIKEGYEPLVPILAGHSPEYLMLVPKN